MRKPWRCAMICSAARDMTVSEPLAPVATLSTDQRLHPWSWMFAMVAQLRAMLLPIVLLVVFGRGDRWVWLGLIGAGSVAMYSWIYSRNFRYRIGASELLVRAGIFSKVERHIPFARIQNIVQKRHLLHRIFGVTELRLESAGGAKPEAVMNVITVEAADALERVLRDQPTGAQTVADAVVARPWVELRMADLLRLGLLSNRGWALIGALLALSWQFEDNQRNPMRQLYQLFEQGFSSWSHAFLTWTTKLFSFVLLALLLLLLIKLVSMLMTVIQFYQFQLSGDQQRLATHSGLLTRHTASARRDKIQRLIVGESGLARIMSRRWLSCEVAGSSHASDPDQKTMRLRWLLPIGTASEVETIAARVLPGLNFAALHWQPLHANAWRRVAKGSLVWWLFLLIPGTYFFGLWMIPLAATLAAAAYLHARGWAAFAAYAWDGEFIAFRAGWLHRRWTVARIDKGQSISLTHTPFDRRNDMQTLQIDTAGASSNGISLAIPYLPTATARSLADALGASLT